MDSVDSKDDYKESVQVKFEKDEMSEDHKIEELETKDQVSVMSKPKDSGQHGENNFDGKDDAETRPGSAIVSADMIINSKDSVQHMETESSVAKKNITASKRKMPNRSEPMPDSIGARLRARRRICSQ